MADESERRKDSNERRRQDSGYDATQKLFFTLDGAYIQQSGPRGLLRQRPGYSLNDALLNQGFGPKGPPRALTVEEQFIRQQEELMRQQEDLIRQQEDEGHPLLGHMYDADFPIGNDPVALSGPLMDNTMDPLAMPLANNSVIPHDFVSMDMLHMPGRASRPHIPAVQPLDPEFPRRSRTAEISALSSLGHQHARNERPATPVVSLYQQQPQPHTEVLQNRPLTPFIPWIPPPSSPHSATIEHFNPSQQIPTLDHHQHYLRSPQGGPFNFPQPCFGAGHQPRVQTDQVAADPAPPFVIHRVAGFGRLIPIHNPPAAAPVDPAPMPISSSDNNDPSQQQRSDSLGRDNVNIHLDEPREHVIGDKIERLDRRRWKRCDVCGEAFRLTMGLKTHERKLHGTGPIFECRHCGMAYKSQGSLWQHGLNCRATKT